MTITFKNTLTQDYLKKFDVINIAKNGSMSNFSDSIGKFKMADNNYLFVSLGGLGMEALARLKTEMARTVEIPEGFDKPANVEFLAIDSDRKTIEKRTSGDYECNLNGTNEVFEIFNNNLLAAWSLDNIDDSIKEWIDPRLFANYAPSGLGCGGIRQVGRYLLAGNRLALHNVITAKMNRLIGTNPGKRLIVYIICGIGGGTGSGTVIDATYLIRKVNEVLRLPNTKIGGCLMLADVQYSDIADESVRKYLQHNCYAALKEINYFMGKPSYYLKYPDGYVVASDEQIFNTCILLSGLQQHHGTMATNSKNKCCEVLNNLLIDLCTQSQLHQANGGTMPIDSFLDNAVVGIAGAVDTLGNTLPKNAIFNFNVLGSHSISLPTEQIYNYITYKTLEKLEEAWSVNQPSTNEIDGFLNVLSLHGDSLSDLINQGRSIRLEFNANEYYRSSKEDVLNKVCVNSMEKNSNIQNVEIYKEFDVLRQKISSEIIKQLNAKIEKDIQDKGLYYVYQFLNSSISVNDDFNGFKKRMETDVKEELEGLIRGSQKAISISRQQMERIEDELKEFRLNPLKSDKSLIKSYVNQEITVLKHDEQIKIYNQCQIIVDEIISNVDVKTQEIKRYIDSLDVMKRIIQLNKENPNINLKSDCFDLKNTDETGRLLEYIDANLPNTPGDIQALSNSFCKHIFKEEEKALWTGNANVYSPAKSLVKFIDTTYNTLLNSSMDTYLQIAFGEEDYDRNIQNLYNDLVIGSDLLIHPSTFPIDSMPKLDHITIPSNSTKLQNDIGKLVTTGANVTGTRGSNKITMLHWRTGVPLYALSNIIEYEMEYENKIKQGSDVGIHISASPKDNWKNFPILSNPLIWNKNQINEREINIQNILNEKVQFALDHGFIYQDVNINSYHIHVVSESSRDSAREKCIKIFEQYKKGKRYIDVENLDYYQLFINSGIFEFNDIAAFNGSSYLPQTINNLTAGIRMNMSTMKQLTETVNLALDLKELFVDFNQKEAILTKRKENVKNFKEFYLYGMLKKIGDVWLYQSDKQSKEKLLVTITRMTVIQKEYDLYACYKRMFNEKEEPLLEQMEYMELLAYKKSFDIEIDNGNETIISQYNSARDIFDKECSEKNKKLNTFAEQRRFQDNDESELYNELLSFYQLLTA